MASRVMTFVGTGHGVVEAVEKANAKADEWFRQYTSVEVLAIDSEVIVPSPGLRDVHVSFVITVAVTWDY